LTRSKAIEIGIRSAIEFFYFDDIARQRGVDKTRTLSRECGDRSHLKFMNSCGYLLHEVKPIAQKTNVNLRRIIGRN
jgi:hypothetical protein